MCLNYTKLADIYFLLPTPSVLTVPAFYVSCSFWLSLYPFSLVLCNEIKYNATYNCWPVTMSPPLIRSTWHSLRASRNINPVLNRIIQGRFLSMQYKTLHMKINHKKMVYCQLLVKCMPQQVFGYKKIHINFAATICF